MAKSRIYLTSLLLLSACFSRSAMMTRPEYENITVGESLNAVQARVGVPYAIQSKEQGVEQYEYIERIPLGTEVVEERRYYLLVKNGKVVGKFMNQETPPPYDMLYDEDPNDTDLQ